MSGLLAERQTKKRPNTPALSAASQLPLYSLPDDSMLLHHSCSAPRPWSGSTGEMICVYFKAEPPFTCEAGREIIPRSFAVSGGAVVFTQSQTAAYIVHFIAVVTTAAFASLSSPVHSLSRTHAPSLSLAH